MTAPRRTMWFNIAATLLMVAWAVGCGVLGYPVGVMAGAASALVCAVCAVWMWSLDRSLR